MAATPHGTPALWQFLGAYLHQDWPLEFDDEWAALGRFAEDSPELAGQLPVEIDLVLRANGSEGDLRTFLIGEGCNYIPDAQTGGYRGWLTEIARRVSASIEPGTA